MRISDWSSDVCSSNFIGKGHARRCEPLPEHRRSGPTCRRTDLYAAFLRSAGTHLEHANQWKSASVRARCPSSHCDQDRKSDVEGKSVSERVDLVSGRFIKKKYK